MNLLWNAQEDVRSLKSLILFGVRGMAAYAHHAMMLGYGNTASCADRTRGMGIPRRYISGE